MAHRTVVTIFVADDEDDRFLDPAGTGTLVVPDAVLVHPPLSHRLAANASATPVQVSVANFDANGSSVELLDVAGMEQADALLTDADDVPAEPVVGLRLSAPSACPPAGGFRSEADAVAHLRDPYGEPPSDGPTHGSSILCRLLHMFCG